ncbi:MAG: hypothetical protein ACOC2H_03485 [Spirochaetota bacterium]
MKRICVILCLALLASCATVQREEQAQTGEATVLGGDVSLTITVRDTAIGRPEDDRRCYYRVFIDKVEAGRTDIALESQRKSFTATVERNTHLIRIEKYVLDPEKERYVKLNNIQQPKPDYFYIESAGKTRQTVTIEHNVQTNQATYSVR